LTVSAYDNHLDEFDKDQYDLMNFNIEAEMTGVIKQQGLKAIQTIQSNRVFEAKGIEPGIYQIVATTLRYNYLNLKS
jgi:outer membrane protein assembly factor BamA